MSNGKKYIKRYNDDFYLNFDGTDKMLVSSANMSEIDQSTDWSISLFIYITGSSSQNIIDTRGLLSQPNTEGFLLQANRVTSENYGLRLVSGIGTSSVSIESVFSSFKKTGFNHIVLNYNSVSQEISIYNNSLFIESLDVSSFNLEHTNTNLTLGRYSQSFLSPLVGGIRDFVTFDKILSDDEINYIYYNGVLPVSSYSNLQHYYPLNQKPIWKEPYTLNYSQFINPTGSYSNWVLFNEQFIGDSIIEFTNLDQVTYAVGLTTQTSPISGGGIASTLAQVEFSTFLNSTNEHRVLEFGSFRGTTTSASNGDTVSIERIGTDVIFKVNGVTTWTKNGASTQDYNIIIWIRNDISFAGNDFLQDLTLNGNRLVEYQDISTDRVQYHNFIEDKANLYNSSAIAFDLKTEEFTDSSLGIPTNTTATTYRDFNDKTNFIPPVGYYKGLNFNSSNNNYIEVQGLDTFSKNEGYTFLIGAEKTFDTGQQSIFSCVGDEGFSDYYDIFRRGGGNDNEFQFTSPQTGSQTSTSSNDLNNNIDVTEKNFISYLASPLPTKIIKPYGGTVITKIIDVNCQQSYNSAFFDSSRHLTLGFDELTNPIFQIGARIGSNRLNGKIYFLSIIKRILTKQEEKEIYNNGFFRSPFEVIKDTDKIILDVDFKNPFLNGSDIEFTDNSGNCTLIANGTNWTTLTGVQNSID